VTGDPRRAAVSFLATWWAHPHDGETTERYLWRTEGHIKTLHQVGLLDDAEAEEWRRRYRLAADDRGEPVTDMTDRIIEAIDAAFDQVEPIAAGGDEHLRLLATLHAADALKAIPEEQRNEWLATLASLIRGRRVELRSRPEPPRPPAQGRNRVGGNLRRVVVGPPDRKAGLRIMSVELYDDSVAVQWHYTHPELPGPDERPRGGRRVELSDEVGTAYFGLGAHTTRVDRAPKGPPVVRGSKFFVPAVPDEVRSVNIVYEGETLVVGLAPGR
jgi:hypothetical protein